MKDYLKLTAIFLVLFIAINLETGKVAPPTFNYFFCALIILFGYIAFRRHKLQYVKKFLLVTMAVQFVFNLAIPYWILQKSMPLNATWPYFPEVLWATGSLVLWYYIISLVFVPVVVYLYGRRAWCTFICGTGALAETIGDPYRTRGAKAGELPRGFVVFKWAVLALSVTATVAALAGYAPDRMFNLIFLVLFILFLRTLLMQAVNIILMPKLGTRVWCRYFCPQGLLIGLISRSGRFALVKNEALCAKCGTCNSNCSMGIDITGGPAVNRSGECVGCGICVEVCPQKALSLTSDTKLTGDKTVSVPTVESL
ncbi:MAG: 4Fe-4S binding protein [Peptococcaceae bacterium]|nr:4Fe-4S binding protein [Peptococcaceae bacterium]